VFEAARTRLLYGARLRRAPPRAVRGSSAGRSTTSAGSAPRPGATPQARSWPPPARPPVAATRRPGTTSPRAADRPPAGRGSTTREAAAALFLSPKTIEFHLRSVYRKLDINSGTSSPSAWPAEQAHPDRRARGLGRRQASSIDGLGQPGFGASGARAARAQVRRREVQRLGQVLGVSRRGRTSARGPTAARSCGGSSSARTVPPTRPSSGEGPMAMAGTRNPSRE
jgi:hypothetical protein